MTPESTPERRWVLVFVLAVVSVGAGVWYGKDATGTESVAPVPSQTVADPTVTTVPVTIAVHVAGWVVDPGVVIVHPPARVGDAVAAAGGARPGARFDGINLAQPLGDGDQIVVPGPLTVETPGGTAPHAPADDTVHLNSATLADLERLPGVGPVLAERIAAYRESHGPFEAIEDLLDISGIGEAKLEAIRELATVP